MERGDRGDRGDTLVSRRRASTLALCLNMRQLKQLSASAVHFLTLRARETTPIVDERVDMTSRIKCETQCAPGAAVALATQDNSF